MIHQRSDYDRIQDPSGKIPDDEPVFLLRAKDLAAPATVDYWALRAESLGASPEMVETARRLAQAMRDYQRNHPSRVPDMPRDIGR